MGEITAILKIRFSDNQVRHYMILERLASGSIVYPISMNKSNIYQ